MSPRTRQTTTETITGREANSIAGRRRATRRVDALRKRSAAGLLQLRAARHHAERLDHRGLALLELDPRDLRVVERRADPDVDRVAHPELALLGAERPDHVRDRLLDLALLEP